MGDRADPAEVIWQYAPLAFAFLLEDWDFEGPERTEDGLAYHRPDLHVSVAVWAWKNETGFTTTVHGWSGRDGSQISAPLVCLYVACGFGTAYDVPEFAGSSHVIRKRIGQHASALCRVMPHLTCPTAAELLRQCAAREQPDAGDVQPERAASIPAISPRLVRRLENDFPRHADAVLDRLHALDPLVAESRQGPERIFAAVIRLASGRLNRLDTAIALARLDWRDLLVAADLADDGWSARLSAWLGPDELPAATASPRTHGELVEADGHTWVVTRRRLDLRIVRRLIHRPDVVVVLGESGGFHPRRITADERHPTWETVRRAYAGPGGPDCVDRNDYIGHEFADAAGTIMLYLEERC